MYLFTLTEITLEADQMTGAKYIALLYSAGTVMLLADLVFSQNGFSESFGLSKGFLYYTSISFSIFLFHLFIYLNFKNYFITFLLLGLSLNKLMDELFFNPTKLQLNELLFTILIVIFGIYKFRKRS